jgi:hypothetical protein
MANDDIHVEVCFITPQKQFLEKLNVHEGCTIQEAIMQSHLADEFPNVDFSSLKVGIYSKLKSLDTVLRDLDRIEIYRPLDVDPMVARRQRAGK